MFFSSIHSRPVAFVTVSPEMGCDPIHAISFMIILCEIFFGSDRLQVAGGDFFGTLAVTSCTSLVSFTIFCDDEGGEKLRDESCAVVFFFFNFFGGEFERESEKLASVDVSAASKSLDEAKSAVLATSLALCTTSSPEILISAVK